MTKTIARRRCTARILVSAIAACATAPVGAQATMVPTHTIAVLSLVGDQMDIVNQVVQTGHLLEANGHQFVDIQAAGVDIAALRAAKGVFARLDPTADVALLTASRSEWYSAQEGLFDGGRARLPAELDAALRREHAGQLVLITKYRAETKIQAYDTKMGSGKVAGLGFYVDFHSRMRDVDTNETSRGYISPFAYVRLTLIDTATGNVLRDTTRTETNMIMGKGDEADRNPWEVLSAQRKLDELRELLGAAVEGGLPQLFAPAAPAAPAAPVAGPAR